MRRWLDKEETDDDKVCLEVQGRKKKQPSTYILQNKRVELKWSRWCWCELQTMTEMLKVHSEASYNALLKLCALFLTFRSRLESKLEMEGKDCNRYLLKETLRSSLWSWLLLSLKKRGNDDDSFFFFDFGCCFSNRCSENKFRSVLLRRTTPIFWSHIRFRLLSSLSWEREEVIKETGLPYWYPLCCLFFSAIRCQFYVHGMIYYKWNYMNRTRGLQVHGTIQEYNCVYIHHDRASFQTT